MNENIIMDSTNSRLAIEYLYCIEMYHTMTFKVKSKSFSGESSFCISNDILMSILKVLELMESGLKGSVQFRDFLDNQIISLKKEE